MAKILLAEDHTGTRTTMGGLLRAAGHEVDVAASGVEAVLLLKQKTYHLLVTDIMMPEGTGFEVTQHLRNRKLMIPILRCTAYGAEKGKDKSLEGFRFSALSKPFRPEALLSAVQMLLAPPKK